MWETSMKGLVSLIRKSTPSSFTYICEKNGDSLFDKMDELACFAPGMLALGSLDYGPGDREKMLTLAKRTLLELEEDLQGVEREFGVAESRYRLRFACI
ncbi:hypothetical protein Scep_030082 [Stephania cephalantha]|uniref:Uncharacterized protein n=1 Tax=Stephania cephalantha TaxID=152367 RepID=A0AAP0HGJ7_9MAGN